MGKFGTYLMIMGGLTLLFYFTGLLPETSESPLLNILLSPTDLQTSDLSLKAVITIEGILASAIVVAFAVAGNIELGVMVGFSIFLFNRIFDFIGVFSTVNAVNPVLATLIFSPLIFVAVVTLIEWWRGVTT